MARSIDDDFPRRIANADAALPDDGDEEELPQERDVLYLTVALLNMERAIAKVRFITRTQRVCIVVGAVAFLAGTAGTILAWGTSFPFVKPGIGCGLVLLLSAALGFGVWDRPRDSGDGERTVFKPLPELEALAESLRTGAKASRRPAAAASGTAGRGEAAELPAHTRLHAPAPKISQNIRGHGLTVGRLNTTNDVQPSGEYL
ncbi:hypothetical protein [Streptomyces mirabilis]|uniref:hypothetical protein n=1 Tax=Streptomyces mirabilis TaxID=68239 RepID=UPI0036A96084